MSRSLRGDSVYSLLATVAQGGGRFFSNWLIGRIGGPQSLGDVMAGFSLGQLVAIMGPSPAGVAASKFGSAEHAVGLSTESAVGASRHIVLRVCQLMPLLTLVAFLVSRFVYRFTVPASLTVSAFVATFSIWSVSRGLLFGRQRARINAIFEVVGSIAAVLGTFFALSVGGAGAHLLIPLMLVHVLHLPNVFSSIRGASADSGLRREIDRFIFYGVVGMIASGGYLNLTVVIVRSSQGAAAAGQFSAAMAVSMPLMMATSSFVLVFYPRLASLWAVKDLAGYRKLTDLASRGLGAFLFAGVGCLVILSSEVTALVWGAEFAASAAVMPVILASVLIKGWSSIAVASMTAGPTWGMRASAIISAVSALLGILTQILIGGSYGVFGFAIGYLFGTYVGAAVSVVVVLIRGRYRWTGWVIRYHIGLAFMSLVYLLIGDGPVAVRLTLFTVGVVVVCAPDVLLLRRALSSRL